MKTRSVALIALFTLALVAPAQAAKPKDGTFTGATSFAGPPCKAADGRCKVSFKLTVKNGKITKFSYKASPTKLSGSVKYKPALKVKKSGAFSKTKGPRSKRITVRGVFTKRNRVSGNFFVSSTDPAQSFPQILFELKRK